jgi:two-component system, sporulation sensor kinase E
MRISNWLPQWNYLYVFSTIAVVIVGASLWYSNNLVSKLANKEERLVEFWTEAYKFITANDECESIFLTNSIIIKRPYVIHVPAILTDQQGNILMNNIEFDSTVSEGRRKSLLQQELGRMKSSNFKPLVVEYAPGRYHYVYYRETDELIQLRYYPYITFLLLAVFIAIVFTNFSIAQRSQQNKVWAGLAKETAHQLGTPISGLIAWIELLKLKIKDEEDDMIVQELEKDINHLQNIADRFSKVGSEPDLMPYPLSQLLEQSMVYVRSRVSQRKVTIELEDQLPAGFKTMLSPPLFEWVIENLLKNAIDAVTGKPDGKILIQAQLRNNQIQIDVCDNGKGITRADLRSIFKPGFTTKKRGWGLGLSLSRRIIVRFHRGRIFVRKTEIDKGTTFRILLPLHKMAIDTAQRPSKSAAQA